MRNIPLQLFVLNLLNLLFKLDIFLMTDRFKNNKRNENGKSKERKF